MKIAFYTLGCKANQFDEAMMKQELHNQGLEFVSLNTLADVYIIKLFLSLLKGKKIKRQTSGNTVFGKVVQKI